MWTVDSNSGGGGGGGGTVMKDTCLIVDPELIEYVQLQVNYVYGRRNN